MVFRTRRGGRANRTNAAVPAKGQQSGGLARSFCELPRRNSAAYSGTLTIHTSVGPKGSTCRLPRWQMLSSSPGFAGPLSCLLPEIFAPLAGVLSPGVPVIHFELDGAENRQTFPFAIGALRRPQDRTRRARAGNRPRDGYKGAPSCPRAV